MTYRNRNIRDPVASVFLVGFIVLLFVAVQIVPKEEWPAPYPRQDLEQHRLVHAGPEAVTVPSAGLDAAAEARATAALAGAAYHAAYAEGPDGRIGLWTGAHSTDLARTYALAACGAGCRVLAERRPLHGTGPSDRPVLYLSSEMARRLGEAWPFTGRSDALAVGGAGAWGTGYAPGTRNEFTRAVNRAVAECEARRLAEPAPEGLEPPPCRAMSLNDLKIEDIRPSAPRYPAPYTRDLSVLVEMPKDQLRRVDGEGVPRPAILFNRRPTELYGARASNGVGRASVIHKAGWPEAGADLALRLCEARRRFGDPPCAVVARRMPPDTLPDGTLAATPEMMEAFRIWENTPGAGAFAVSALGVWGSSSNCTSLEDARQVAADWCAYYARRGYRASLLRSAFIDQPPCRIVAERAATATGPTPEPPATR